MVHYIEFFHIAQITYLRYWAIRFGSSQNLPFDIIAYILAFQVPDICTKTCLFMIFFIVKTSFVLGPSYLEIIPCASSIVLCISSIMSFNFCSIYNFTSLAMTIQGTRCFLLSIAHDLLLLFPFLLNLHYFVIS